MVSSARIARHWIDSQWVDSERRLDSIDPATGQAIGSYADGGDVEARRAITAARRAFVETGWREDRRLRARALNEMADCFEASEEDLIAILALENGKVNENSASAGCLRGSRPAYYGTVRFFW
jgi:betaine-aldehyde dehydrogenase